MSPIIRTRAVDRGALVALCLGCIGSVPLLASLMRDRAASPEQASLDGPFGDRVAAAAGIGSLARWGKLVFSTTVLVLAASYLIGGAFNPFIYFRF